MGSRCILFTEDLSVAHYLEASGVDDLAEDDRAFLQQHSCTEDRFMDCPLFRLLERGLADRDLLLGRTQRAGKTNSIVTPSDTDTLEECNGALC